jgi:exodeoxyribonuclease-5
VLTKEQTTAKDRIMLWMDNGYDTSWMFYLGGYAGTGKTFLLGDIINSLDKKPHCLAPTGKAASVLQKKLKGVPVNTIHSALYKPNENHEDIEQLKELRKLLAANPEDEYIPKLIEDLKRKMMKEKLTFSDKEKQTIEEDDLVIIDEASMVTSKMMFDLEQSGAKVLFVGDPGQLPPVGDNGYFSHEKPDALLSEVQRQALDNPIIALSMAIRQGKEGQWLIESEQIRKRPKEGFSFVELSKVDQILTGTNVMRRKINRGVRTVMGIDRNQWYPRNGEKLICLKNRNIRQGFDMSNGVICSAVNDCECVNGDLLLDVLYDGELFKEQKVYPFPFEAHYNPKATEEPRSLRHHWAEFDYGYCITVHKSQGSEWDNVVLVDDDFAKRNKDRKRWLYTAVTRAKEKLTWLT